jgi:hypothetical protein
MFYPIIVPKGLNMKQRSVEPITVSITNGKDEQKNNPVPERGEYTK